MRPLSHLILACVCATVLGCGGPGQEQTVPPDGSPMDGPPAETPPGVTEILCTPGPNIEIGYGAATSIAAGPEGFGTVRTSHARFSKYWVGNLVMVRPDGEETHTRFGFLLSQEDIHFSIVGTSYGYAISMPYNPQMGIWASTFWFYGQDGTYAKSVTGLMGSGMRVVAGSTNEALWFKYDPASPDCHQLASGTVSSDGLKESRAYPWKYCGEQALLSSAAAAGDSVAVGMNASSAEVGGIILLIVRGEEVRAVRIAHAPTAEGERVILHEVVSTDDGYAVIWSKDAYEERSGKSRLTTRGYLASVPHDLVTEGIVASYEIPSMSKSHPWSWHLAWDGRRLGLLGSSHWTGGATLALIRKDGAMIEEVGLPDVENGEGYWESSLAYHASGTYGTLIGDGERVWFRNVICR